MNGLRYVNWLEGEEKRQPREVEGGKGAELIEGQQFGPRGFSVDSRAYLEFLSINGLFREIRDLLTGVDLDSVGDLWGRSAAIRQLIMGTSLPEHIEEEIITAYEQLASRVDGSNLSLSVDGTVMVTAAEQPAEKLMERYDPYLNISGPDQVVWYVKRCWARLWTPRAIYCREQLGCHHLDVLPKVKVEEIPVKEAAIA